MTEQTINGSNGNDILIGTTDNDVFNAWRGSDSIIGSLGDDNFFLSDDGSNDTIDGGAGRDSLYFQLSPNNVTFKDNITGIEALLVRTSSLSGQGGTVTISDKILSGSNQLTFFTENYKDYGVLIDASSFSSANSV
jgi:Ca2+-binding RTX toxin-like protein